MGKSKAYGLYVDARTGAYKRKPLLDTPQGGNEDGV